MPEIQPRVIATKNRVKIKTRPHHTYAVLLSRIPNEAAVVEWVHHLCGKEWANPELLREFIDVTYKAKGWVIYRHNV